MFMLYSASDAMARLQWNEKLIVLDRFHQGRILNYSTGISIRNGMFLGVLTMGIYTATLYIYANIFNGILSTDNNLEYNFSILFPVATILLTALNKAIFNEIFFRLFGISTITRWVKKNQILIVGTLIFSFTFSTEIVPQNVFARYAIFIIPTFLFIYFFVKHEIVTTLFGFLTFLLLGKGIVFYTTSESFIQQVGFSVLFIGVIIILFAVSLILFKREETEKPTIFVPDYIKQMEEKERLIRELEIARNVQEKFLPFETPTIVNYQIAAFCQPAWEVGGDYFDYFQLDKNRLGITIGDVSNKGVSAAFYMTMVKGFLKSLALHLESPREILSQTNKLFYENVERGHFISMIFGILDYEKNEFVFARAGHNPLLLLVGESQTGQWLVPQGIAIGLTTDDNFRAAIKEEKIIVKAGDAVILYTDGYPESMNEKSEEFGEDKLETLINSNTHLSSREIIELLEKRIKEWEGERPASDDRTIVVIKRTK
jgi:sigma-B regulation protein RsbU (phosphoserine phosphatase)